MNRVSCWCCSLKGLKDYKSIYINYPEYWNKLKEMHEKLTENLEKIIQ